MNHAQFRIMLRLVFFSLVLQTAIAVDKSEVNSRIAAMNKNHPRLFLDSLGEQGLKDRLPNEPLIAALHRANIAEADKTLGEKPVARVLIGRRLLDKSRTALSRLMHWSYAWRMTGDTKYLDRAKTEMLAIAEFSDWNPSHFLDVAEMSAAMAIGYDWLYIGLDEITRDKVRAAILDKGVTPSLSDKHWWINSNNNWNQVCHAGMVMGVLAIHDADPSQTATIVARAVDGLPQAMDVMAPDGAYPEGAGYWGYGTTFNVMLIAALESALGTDFGLSSRKGFLPTADYYLHVTGPTMRYFNYADCGNGGGSIQPAMFWFASRRKDSYLLWNELGIMARAGDKGIRSSDRIFPLVLAWAPELPVHPVPPKELSWTGNGPMPVGLHRSAWTPEATYLGIKGGSPSLNHAHMDVGAFVVEALGQRWADDLGMQDYNSLEQKKVDLWNNKQESQRWKVFRLSSFSHSVLTVDGQQQRVKGKASIVKHKPGFTVIDQGSVYEGQLTRAQRGAALLADGSVLIQDEIATDKAVTVRWAMLTRAEVKVTGLGQATLTQQDKALAFQVLEPAEVEVKIWPTDPPSDIDVPNPGTRLMGFEVKLPAGAILRLVNHLDPASGGVKPVVKPLAEW